MVPTMYRICCYIIYLTLFLGGVCRVAEAHEIELKSGGIIKTDYIKRSGSYLTYDQFGGMVTIPLSQVEKITYGTKSSARAEAGQPPEEEGAQEDLAAQLIDKLAPRTPIEEANMSVVSITTEAGSGSGFFVSDDGLIITNRHVVRGSESNGELVEEKMAEAAGRLERVEQGLSREKERLDTYTRNLKKNKEAINKSVRDQRGPLDQEWLRDARAALKEKGKYLANWRSDYQARWNTYQKERRKFEKFRREYRQKNSRLARQSRFQVTLADGSEKSALLYRVSDALDLALLKLNGYKTPYLQPAESSGLALGQRVFAIGSPLQLNNSVTSGVISNYRGDYVQTNAEIYPGNSGGPLVTEQGKVLGVNTMKLITEKFEGLGFAIHYSRVRSEFEDFLKEQ